MVPQCPLGDPQVVPGRRGCETRSRRQSQLLASACRIAGPEQHGAQAGTQAGVVGSAHQGRLQQPEGGGRTSRRDQAVGGAQHEVRVVGKALEAVVRDREGLRSVPAFLRDVSRNLEGVGRRGGDGNAFRRRRVGLVPALLGREGQGQVGACGSAAGILERSPTEAGLGRRGPVLSHQKPAVRNQCPDIVRGELQRVREGDLGRCRVVPCHLDLTQRQPDPAGGQARPLRRLQRDDEARTRGFDAVLGQVHLGQFEQGARMVRHDGEDLAIDRRGLGTPPCRFECERLRERVLQRGH